MSEGRKGSGGGGSSSLGNYLHSWYREYEFVTAVYLLEPWEKRIVNSVMAGIALFTVFSAYTYLPHYSSELYSFITGRN